jgi:hypothetical protein
MRFAGCVHIVLDGIWGRKDAGATRRAFTKRQASHDVVFLRLKPVGKQGRGP